MRILSQPQAVADWLRERVSGSLQCDSRRVRAGDGFVAWPGAATDGRRFVSGALQAGASVALVEQEGSEVFDLDPERVLAVPGLKQLAGLIASAFHGDPSSALDVVAFTGTNGKTSSAWWMAQLLTALGRSCAVVGTLGIGQPPLKGQTASALVSTGLTTPDPVLLQSRLRDMVAGGAKACAIEASSIGLIEGRLNATRIKVAVFTNFTQDHLDFHGSMSAYWSAKAALFDWPGLVHAVVNTDDPKGVELVQSLVAKGLDIWTVGLSMAVDGRVPRLLARELGFTDDGMHWVVDEHDSVGEKIASCDMSLPLVGQYNVANLLGVLASARALGFALTDAVEACGHLTPVPGRMEQVAAAEGQPLVLVDYAHTPDALEKALQALQALARQRQGRLWAVAGCGGDRDASKRPLMAAVAEREAQRVVLTSDNPRSEDPMDILRQMQAGLARSDQAVLIGDRAEAIAHAVQNAGARDVVLIAGKGHEDYQDIMGVKKPFSDVAHAREALAGRLVQRGGGGA